MRKIAFCVKCDAETENDVTDIRCGLDECISYECLECGNVTYSNPNGSPYEKVPNDISFKDILDQADEL